MEGNRVKLAMEKLGVEFAGLDLSFHPMDGEKKEEITSYWPGGKTEDIVICVFKGNEINEPFHRQDFFFLNFAYANSYDALSEKYDNLISVRENDLYIGQPYSGYALRGQSDEEMVIVGVLVRKEAFFRDYLPVVYADAELFRFFIDPQTNRYSDEFIHLSLSKDHAIRSILELMVVEYADAQSDTQRLLRAMLQTLLLEVSRQCRLQKLTKPQVTISERILSYMDDHSDAVTLKAIASHFGYHPNYVSSLLRKETGRTFSEILLEKRMGRAALLLHNTPLSVEDIASILGYGNHSNFYKAFKSYYGTTPREYLAG